MMIRAALVPVLLMLTASACSAVPDRSIDDASTEVTTPLHERLLAPADVESLGWVEAEFRPDHPTTVAADPTARRCDGDYSAPLASTMPRTSASRVYLDGDTVIQMSLMDGVTSTIFTELQQYFDACAGSTTDLAIGDLPGIISIADYDLELPEGAFAVDTLILTELTAMRQVQMFAHTDDDALLSVTLVYPGSDARTAEVLERTITAARGS